MLRKAVAACAVACAAVLSVPVAAHAAADYTPDGAEAPSLAGSTAVASCQSGAPVISYSVVLSDPGDVETKTATTLTLTDGENSLALALGDLVDDRLSGQISWANAPAWTHGDITATISVNPSIDVPLAYPGDCATDATPALADAGSAALAETGMSSAVLPIGIAGGALALGGAALLVARRLARR